MGKYGDVMPNNPRSVTRTLFANPIFWAMLGAYLAGRVTPLDAPDWIGPASGLACAILAGLIERWYVYPRTPDGRSFAINTPDVFRSVPVDPTDVCEHGALIRDCGVCR